MHLSLKVLTAIILSLSGFTILQAQDLYLIIGQSNAAGRGDLPANPTALTGVQVLQGNDTFAPAFPNLNVHSTVRNLNQTAGFNIGYTFARSMRIANGNDIQLVVNARGGTSIVNWFPGVIDDAPSLSYFDEAVRRVNAARSANPNAILRGILWHQGESNRNSSAYIADLVTLVGLLRSQIGDVPFVAGQLSHERDDNETFNTNLLQLPNLLPNSAVVTAEGLATIDLTHFTADAAQTFGLRYVVQMQALQTTSPAPAGTLRPLLFGDTFNRLANSNLNATTTGQSGSLSPLTYTSDTFNVAAPDISDNSLRMQGTSSSVASNGSIVYLNHNFIEPAIVTGGGFSVTVDIAEYSTTGNTSQMSIGVGQSLAELTGISNVATSQLQADLVVAYRDITNTLEIHKNGTNDTDETTVGGLPDDPATMRIDFLVNSFDEDSLVSYQVFFNSSPIPFTTGTFTWSGTNENYISLSSNLNNNSRFDNLQIRGGAEVIPVDYAAWVTQFTGIDLSDISGDLDGDGIDNNSERIWGLNPNDATSSNPYLSLPSIDGQFTYTRRSAALSSLSYLIEASTDLITWVEDTDATQQILDTDTNSVETVSVNIASEPAEGHLFVRVVAKP